MANSAYAEEVSAHLLYVSMHYFMDPILICSMSDLPFCRTDIGIGVMLNRAGPPAAPRSPSDPHWDSRAVVVVLTGASKEYMSASLLARIYQGCSPLPPSDRLLMSPSATTAATNSIHYCWRRDMTATSQNTHTHTNTNTHTG